ncbi:MAG: BPL-N domain-containing protein [Cardiobacteriaceae bacterium]|nr:BPL-N domain-containing protein [Cardiobacteriaceae bacterium]
MLVWLYDDDGVGQEGLAQLQSALPRYWQDWVIELECVNAERIQSGIVADMLVIGGGADLPYCRRLHGKGTEAIKRFVANGGIYLGICAGAYFACQQVDFRGEGYRIYGSRELGFFTGIARGSWKALAGGRLYDLTANSRSELVLPEFPEHRVVYHGGCAFIGQAERVVARYPHHQGMAAIIAGQYGKGAYLLSGVHFEGMEEGAVFFAKLRAIIEETLHLAASSTCNLT